jgi:uncharacterized membrane protein YdfJ with MMPL/SSD domain
MEAGRGVVGDFICCIAHCTQILCDPHQGDRHEPAVGRCWAWSASCGVSMGYFCSFLHYQSPGSLDSLTPPIVIAFVFGLSMDYEIFLVTRIREKWEINGDSQRAVREALIASAGAIGSAALILVCALGVFVAVGGSSVKEIGVGIAVAIAVDATLIRLGLVPATMNILGDWNWWWPHQIGTTLRTPRRWLEARRKIKTPA